MDLRNRQEASLTEKLDVRPAMSNDVHIRELNAADPEIISEAFNEKSKPVTKYQRYMAETAAGTRICLIALLANRFVGYVTVNWAPTYPGFLQQKIPEIQDLNVLPAFRRKGLATRLLDRAEEEVARRSSIVGIGFGLHPGYGSAQRLYVKRGYVPDGRGVFYRDQLVEEGMQATFDDNLVIHLTKQLRPRPA